MKIINTVTTTITFSIQAFWDEEGGMGSDSFGKSVNTLEEAIELLRLARIKDSENDWIIVGDVTDIIKE